VTADYTGVAMEEHSVSQEEFLVEENCLPVTADYTGVAMEEHSVSKEVFLVEEKHHMQSTVPGVLKGASQTCSISKQVATKRNRFQAQHQYAPLEAALDGCWNRLHSKAGSGNQLSPYYVCK
jgi:hypothetical protein